MADPRKKLAENVEGEFFVDSSCIDCDLCRQIAPSVFREENGSSVVHHQPATPGEVRRAEMALVTCPTASIGTATKRDLRAAIASFPERITDGVFFCGFASEASYGASSYLILRPEGNVLVDSPRFAAPLVRRIESMGGARFMFLTHRDDVADHEKFRAHFGCERILHEADAEFAVERLVRGSEPVPLARDLLAIPTPGHTQGHQVLLSGSCLFTGDHLWGEPEAGRLGASRSVCWYSWAEQRRSMERLRAWPFEWVLPGHGARLHAPPVEMRRKLEALLALM